ncbi:hypothetical protein HBH49_027160 [Parastagonospora nodorum]|nr:hypothetical protein HBH49_027160 [Parastagonospora nodorum]
MISSNSMSQTNVREGYRITTLEVVELIEDLISYLLKSLRLLMLKDWLAVAKCIQLRNVQISKYSAKVKTEDLSNMLTLILSETAQRRSLSIMSNRSTALITDKFGVALLTEPAILNNANVALVDAVHYSVVIDALTMTLIEDNNDLLGTVNSYIKLRRLRARRKTKAADSRYAKVSRGRTKKDKDLEDSDTSSDVLRLRRRDRAAACARLAERKQLGKEAQLKKTRDEEELAKAKKEKEEKEAWERETYLDIDSEDDLEDEEVTTAKDLAREQKERLKALLNAKTRDGLSIRTEVQNARAEGDAIEYNAVDDDNKLCPTEGERTFYCADLLALRFCFFSDSSLENIGRLTKEKAMKMQIDTTDAISKALAAANKLVALRSYVLGGFVIVCGFRKVDKHVFRAYNTISVTAQRTIIRKGSSYVEKRVILLLNILEKEGFNKLEASRRVIFNCFEMQVIASYSALATLKAAQFKTYGSCKVKRFTLNSVKDLFTNLSKDYFLVREARAITKSSLKFQNLSNLCSEVKILGTLSRTWSIAAEDIAKAANTLLLLKEVCAKILIESYKLIVQAVTWLGLREKFSNESVLVMQRGMI